MPILICVADLERDPCVAVVKAELETRGQEVVLFETGRFPAHTSLSLDPFRSPLLIDPNRAVDLSTVRAVWNRHLDVGLTGLDALRDDHRAAVRAEASHTLHAVLESLNVFQLDPQSALAATPSSTTQLRLARSYGFDVPRTLISNDPEQVRSWAPTFESEVIVKMVDSAAVGFDGGDGFEPFYAKALSSAELMDLEGLEWCPMVFQEQIPKKLELRVTVVGNQAFAAAVDSTRSSSGATDWRRDRRLALKFRPYDLPGSIEEAVLRLTRRLGLQFATLDIILTPDDRFVFLEANTVSYYDFVEDATGLPISRSIAELLIEMA